MQMNGDLSRLTENEVSLYFHIPFCTKKCYYCHFFVLPNKDPFKKQLLEGLRLEWSYWLPFLKGKTVTSIYFGGGTPALIGPHAIQEIIGWVKDSLPFTTKHPEITLEANPEDVTLQLMSDYAQAGVNRVSIGLQTLDDDLLKVLGRIHNAQKGIEAVHITSEAGINNISVDLIYDLPGQTLQSWESSLEGISQLPITHLSLYNLTIEPQTVFFKYREDIERKLPSHDVSQRMYEVAIELIPQYGLNQYEISAFAKPGFHSRHNVGYWIARPFIGFGPSAFSYWEEKRFRNVANLNRYCRALEKGESPIDFEEKLAKDASQRELLVIQLRLLEGLDLIHFQKRHGELDEITQEDLKRLSHEGLIEKQGEVIRLTKRGIFLYDTVASDLI
jgi:oxygen-independent coproporphyrinogen-3 oxidase